MKLPVLCFIGCGALSLATPHMLESQAAKHYDAYYLAASQPNYSAIVAPPPSEGSPAEMEDDAAVRSAEKTRTADQIREAQRDDAQEDIFLYATVFGPRWNAKQLPKTAALSAHLRNDVGVVSPPLKALYGRPRPFLADKSLHPVCEKSTEGSYPSGHASVGYVTGLVLAQMIPERSAAILARAREYAEHRITCGVHYPSDIDASHTLALVMLGELSTSAKFQADLQEAKTEIRTTLSLP